MQMMPGDPFSLSTSIGAFNQEQNTNPNPKPNPPPKKKRNLPGTPDPDAEVIALSPKTLMATNRFICEICNKGFQRDQNLQLHRRGHNLPWKLRQRSNKEVRKKVYICPEQTCVHHDPSRALGDLTGIKKHFSRKHGEKKWKCEKCSKKYAVQSDWKAHTKTCGTREYKCDCGTLFSRKDSFITHRAFCDALAEESARLTSVTTTNLNFKSEEGSNVMNSQHGLGHGLIAAQGLQNVGGIPQFGPHGFRLDFNGMEQQQRPSLSLWLNQGNPHMNNNNNISNNGAPDVGPNYMSSCSSGLPEIVQMAQANALMGSSSMVSNFGVPVGSNSTSAANLSLSSLPIGKRGETVVDLATIYNCEGQNKQSKPASPMSATALLQKAAQMGSTRSTNPSIFSGSFGAVNSPSSQTTTLNNNNAVMLGSNNNAAATTAGTDYSSLTHSSNSFDQLVMQTNGQLQSEPVKLKLHSNAVEHNLTRDFLGVSGGGGGAGPQFLPQELAKFASMGSPMGLSQFTSNQ
ncbi:zinc finger protein JACKDAW [Cajanus cajan]|uniref:zinc finger protein JACKDAW n=1 Tax=Cajanus cajan TaxID=3821 RepID=UPI00098D8EE0|nr:zinc finger protein JACKDAW [Cajanus cajan]XP_020240162.1 zinc finger protein JACKDAW [Cajanus cajan]XP_020240163.1 zinc finger protein JACKDAW [Cajanus cajan]XP_020240164.1 zinc finger protein JACKDAW [Cajanus cajan]XP_020240165.1 zinc finger protein JACKDAW [Cajanus cajan]